jgi:hypothetical protein
MEKRSFGPVYNLDLFSTCGYICVSKDCVPPKRDLEELITLCGGRIRPSLRRARILVGSAPSERYKHVKYVNEKWVLDSIQFITLKPLSEYRVLREGSDKLWFGYGWWRVNCERWFVCLFMVPIEVYICSEHVPSSGTSSTFWLLFVGALVLSILLDLFIQSVMAWFLVHKSEHLACPFAIILLTSIHRSICFTHEMNLSSLIRDFVIHGIFQLNFSWLVFGHHKQQKLHFSIIMFCGASAVINWDKSLWLMLVPVFLYVIQCFS